MLGAILTGRPVRYVLGREEEMQFASPRGAERHVIKDGVMRDGRIVARQITSYFDAGAYTRLSSYGVVKCVAHMPGPYTIPNVRGDAYCVFTNRVPATAMRGFGVTGVDFSIEVQMDKLAHLVGIDPMEFRILNAYRDGDMKAHRRVAHNTALIECVQVVAEKVNWPLSETARRASSLSGGGGARAAIPPTVTDESGRIGRPETRQAPPQLTPGVAPLPAYQPQPARARLSAAAGASAGGTAAELSVAAGRRRAAAGSGPAGSDSAGDAPARRGAVLVSVHTEALRWHGIRGAEWRPSTIRSA